MSAQTTGERVSVLETKIDTIIDRLDKTETILAENNKIIFEKLNKIMASQEEGHKDRLGIRQDILKMKPDVQTVATVKRIISWSKKIAIWVGGCLTAVGASYAMTKDWVVLNFNWFFNR